MASKAPPAVSQEKIAKEKKAPRRKLTSGGHLARNHVTGHTGTVLSVGKPLVPVKGKGESDSIVKGRKAGVSIYNAMLKYIEQHPCAGLQEGDEPMQEFPPWGSLTAEDVR